MAEPHLTTPINQLLGENVRQSQMPPAEFNNRPMPSGGPGGPGGGPGGPGGSGGYRGGGGDMVTPIHSLQNGGSNYGDYGGGGRDVASNKNKDFLGSVKELDLKMLGLIFFLIFALTTGVFSGILRSCVPGSVGSDNRVTVVGSLFAAVIGTITAIIVSLVSKMV